MAKLPKIKLTHRIDNIRVAVERRKYLGGSYIGNKCKRYVWYNFRWYTDSTIEARLNRLFRLGDFVEEQIIEGLNSVGVDVTDSQKPVGGFWDHASGHIDGIAHYGDEQWLFESKSMSAANFKKVIKEGVEKFKSDYWYQIHGYAGKLGLSKTLWIAYNKDTSEMVEFEIDTDEAAFKEVQDREVEIIVSDSAENFKRIGGPTWYECKFCSAYMVCQYNQTPEVTCRSCKHVDLAPSGRWICSLNEKDLSTEDQLKACDKYELL
jgi:hypothetical protein